MNAQGVAVCVVTHNSAADLPACLAAVGEQSYRPLELVVVDCASEDDSRRRAADCRPPGVPARLVALERNLGFAGGMNRAFAESEAPLVVTLNPDAQPAPDYVERLVECLDRHHDLRVGALTGRLVRPRAPGGDDRRLDACGMFLTPTWRHLDRGSGALDRGQYARPARVFGATGAASLFRRQALDDVALDGEAFLSEFHSFREDAELCFRLRSRGWEVLYEPAAVCEHRRENLPSRRRAMPAAVNYHSLKNRYLLRAYHQDLPNLAATLLPAGWRDLVALGYCLLFERSSLPAYAWLWRHRRLIWRRRRELSRRRRHSVNRWFFRRSLPL